jgi:hypothetical protein
MHNWKFTLKKRLCQKIVSLAMVLSCLIKDAAKRLIVALLACPFLMGCDEEPPGPLDTTKPDLRVDAPVLQTGGSLTFHKGDTLFIKGQASDLHALHLVKVQLARQEPGTEALKIDWQVPEAQITGKTVPFNQQYIFTDEAFTTYVLRIQADDHANNSAYISQSIQVLP